MLNKEQLKSLIDRVTTSMGCHSPAATNLLLGTAAQESRMGTFMRQMGGGPALGVFQMEPATHNDISNNWLKHRNDQWRSVMDASGVMALKAEYLEFNIAYAVAMARVHYLRVPQSLPAADDVEGLASYWKNHYNTLRGKGTAEEFITNYLRYVK